MTTTSEFITLIELLGEGIPNGQAAQVITDNELYGTTVIKKDNGLYNKRTGDPLMISSELLQTKFKIIKEERALTLGAFVEAYRDGKKVKIVLGDKHRILQNIDEDLPEELSFIEMMLSVKSVSINQVVTMEELMNGKFYVLE